MEAIILAGGLGTRLSQVVRDVPKPMAPVAGKPFLQYIVDDLIKQGADRLIFAVCHKKESIMSFFCEQYQGAEIIYSVEAEPLLTGGAIRKAMEVCKEDRVFVINGDTFFPIRLKGMRQFSKERGLAVLAVKELKNFSRYGAISLDKDMMVTAFHEKRFYSHGYINGGVYDLPRSLLEGYPERFSIEQDCFPVLAKKRLLAAYVADEFFIDIGVPEDYERAQTLLGSEPS